MVGIKPTFAPLPLCFWWEEEVEIFANFQELCEMRHGLLTGVCLNIKQSCGGLQMAGRLHSRQGLQSEAVTVGESPSLLLNGSPGEWMYKPLVCMTIIIVIMMAFTTGADGCRQSVHSGSAQHVVFPWVVCREGAQCWVTNKDSNLFILYLLLCIWQYLCDWILTQNTWFCRMWMNVIMSHNISIVLSERDLGFLWEIIIIQRKCWT